MANLLSRSVIWRYRYFILTSIKSDFQSRVARSRLGLLWIVISPLSQVVIYAFVLSSLMSQRLPGIDTPFAYSIYLLAGFQCWFLFVEVINRCLSIFIDNGNALKKISFPRLALPIIAVGSSILNNLIFFGLVNLAFLLVGFHPGWNVLWFPVLLIVTSAFATGFGLICGILNVFMRDVGQVVAIILQFGFWMTPVVYTIDILPKMFQMIVKLNPVYWLVDSYHRVLVYNTYPNLLSLAAIAGFAAVLLALAFMLFRKASGEMVDVL